MESGTGDAALDVGDAYNRLQMPDRNVPDETVLAYYQSLSGGAPAGSKDSYTEALRVIALDRESNFLLRKLDDPNADVQVSRSTIDGPVGLDNIGNTCYLNSLLQFYYTIKPVREVVMNIHSHRMDLDDPKTDEDIRRKRVGGRKVARSEIIKAQKCKCLQ
jgi:ubiquitin carboxyl-terminal hydrolase 25/28